VLHPYFLVINNRKRKASEWCKKIQLCVANARLRYFLLVKQKTLKLSTRRIGIKVVIVKKLYKQEVIGIKMHQFKVSGLNNLHLICDSYCISMFKYMEPEVEIGIASQVYAIQAIYLELVHSHPYYFLFTQFFHDHNFNPYSFS